MIINQENDPSKGGPCNVLINGKSISSISKSCKITRNTVKSTDQEVHQAGYSLSNIALMRMN